MLPAGLTLQDSKHYQICPKATGNTTEEKGNKSQLQTQFLALLVKRGKLLNSASTALWLCGVVVIKEDTSRSFLFVKYFKNMTRYYIDHVILFSNMLIEIAGFISNLYFALLPGKIKLC